jgi:DNA-binding NarL/FixJ family response regulator
MPRLSPSRATVSADLPLADPRNWEPTSTGRRLSRRGAELLYRHLDCGISYGQIARSFGLAKNSVKTRVEQYHALGGLARPATYLDCEP